jgi:hypothetical protein
MRNFNIQTPTSATGATIAAAAVFDAATSTFIAPRSGLYSLTYTLNIGFSFNNGAESFADFDIAVDGASKRVASLSPGVGTGWQRYDSNYYDSVLSPVLMWENGARNMGIRQHVLGGTWTGYLAAGAKVSAELTFLVGDVYYFPAAVRLGLLWTGSSFRFSLIVPY